MMGSPSRVPSQGPRPQSRADRRGQGTHRAGVQPHAGLHVGLSLGLNGQLGLQDLLHGHVLVGAAGRLHLTLAPVLAALPLLLHGWGDGHWSARSSQGSLHPQGPTRQPDRSPVSAPSPASCSHGAVRSENRPRHLSVIHSTTVHTRTAQSQGRRGPALRKLTVQQGSRGGVRRALMGYGRKQSQEGFPEEAAMKLKEQKDRDGHPGGDGGTHQGRGPEQRHCCRGSERARLPDRAQGSRERERGDADL